MAIRAPDGAKKHYWCQSFHEQGCWWLEKKLSSLSFQLLNDPWIWLEQNTIVCIFDFPPYRLLFKEKKNNCCLIPSIFLPLTRITWHEKYQKRKQKRIFPLIRLCICTRGRPPTLDGARRNYLWHHYFAMFTQETQEIIKLCISGLYTMALRQ